MKHTKTGITCMLAFLLFICLQSMALAQGCPKKGPHGHGLEAKLFCKFHLAMANQGILDLTEDQVGDIKALKMALKKDLIKHNAEIELIKIDIKSKLSEDSLDKKTIKKLIDQKYELKKEKAKALVDVCAEFKNILSDEQKKKLKEIKCQNRKCPKGNVEAPGGKRPCGAKP